jgi:NTP pyrophosphatase (non-canonical NTP hydrolase)
MKKIEKRVYAYAKARNWHKLKPGDLAKSIMIEGAELLELFQWDNPTLEEVKKDKEKVKEIAKELADIFIYSIELATELNLDIDKIVEEKLKHVEKKYPAKLIKQSQKVSGPGRSAEYWRIKKEFRKNSL